jgi:Putative zinc-finger
MKRSAANLHYLCAGGHLKTMDHEQAIRSMAVEKYLLDELSPELREAFEEHYFGCQECALDVRAGASFVEHTKVALATPFKAKDAEDEKERITPGRFSWLRPAFALPAMAVLLLVISYQNFVTLPGLKALLARGSAPQVLASVSLISAHAQGGSAQSHTIRRGQGLLLSVEFPTEARFSSYLGKLHSPSGEVIWSVPITAEQARDTLYVQAPRGLTAGKYDFEIVGMGPDQGSPTSLSHYSFELQVE